MFSIVESIRITTSEEYTTLSTFIARKGECIQRSAQSQEATSLYSLFVLWGYYLSTPWTVMEWNSYATQSYLEVGMETGKVDIQAVLSRPTESGNSNRRHAHTRMVQLDVIVRVDR